MVSAPISVNVNSHSLFNMARDDRPEMAIYNVLIPCMGLTIMTVNIFVLISSVRVIKKGN